MAASQPENHGPEGTVELRKKIEAMKLAYTDLYGGDAKRVVRLFSGRGLRAEQHGL
jgi:hypothetical protein